MIINYRYDFMAFMEPHTGSRALAKLLMEIPNSKSIGHHHMTRAYGLERKLLPESSYLSFSVIRDPREIIATQIACAINTRNNAVASQKPPSSDKEIIERYVTAACLRERFYYHNDCDYMIRYDRLEIELEWILTRLGVSPIPLLQKVGITLNKKLWFYYFDCEQLERMKQAIPEIELFRNIL